MKPIDLGALRPSMSDARISDANDLVRRTLAQHGLMPQGDLPAAADPLAAMTGLLKGLAPAAAPAEALVPGARFTPDRFECEAGGRDYLTYVPASAENGAKGMIVMLHGCTQTSADFATGTGMNALAEQHGLVIVYPQQSRRDNAQTCWNWFSRGDQQRGRGEPAILAGMAAKVAAAHGIAPANTYVAGLSAGAAMAVILGQAYPDVFAAVGAHSGLPHGAANDVASAFAAMSGAASGPAVDGLRPTPTIIFQGSADHTVNPANSDRIASDLLGSGPEMTLFDTSSGQKNGRSFVREATTTPEGTPLLEYWKIDGLGHAWSGGNKAGSYTDPQGPDASAEMVRFFQGVGAKAA